MQQLIKFLKDNSIEAYIHFDSNDLVLDFSSNLKNYLKPHQNLIQSIRSILWIEDIPKFEKFLANVKKSGHEISSFEFKVQQNKYEHLRVLGLKGTSNKDDYIICFGRKIFDILNDLAKIENLTNLYKNFSKLFNGIYVEFNEQLEIIHTLGDTFEFFGYKEEEIINFSNLIFEEDLESFNIIHKIENISKNIKDFTFRFKKKDGTVFWVKELLQLFEEKKDKTVCAIFYNIDKHKTEYDELLESKSQLIELANHLELAREQERKDMAREIHDEIGHALTSLKLDINLLLKKRYLREEKLEIRLGEMQRHIEETIRMLQRISAQLRPSILDHFGLIAALEWQAKEFQRQTSIRCKYSLPEEDIELDERKTVAIFRIFQEVLTNIARHSQASRVDVNLTIDNNILDLNVSDNGIGIKKDDLESPKSLGLIGMKERANLVGGKLIVSSILNLGTTVNLTLSLNK